MMPGRTKMTCDIERDLITADSSRKTVQWRGKQHSRREFLAAAAAFGTVPTVDRSSLLTRGAAYGPENISTKFRIWVFADAHVGTDKKQHRESLAEAIRQSESTSGFDWEIALDLGDMSGEQGTPKDPEGEEIIRQFGVLKRHRREDIYDLSAITIAAVWMNH
jgi:hypothetical protein